jgi:hypothetical protein
VRHRELAVGGVADGMTGYRHRSDQELVAQGIANVASVLFCGLPATGAIARTCANIKNGGKTPMAGILHAVILLAFMLILAPLAKAVPLPALAARAHHGGVEHQRDRPLPRPAAPPPVPTCSPCSRPSASRSSPISPSASASAWCWRRSCS